MVENAHYLRIPLFKIESTSSCFSGSGKPILPPNSGAQVKAVNGRELDAAADALSADGIRELLEPRPLRVLLGVPPARPAPPLRHVCFSLVAVQHERKFVLVHEKEERGWWLPGGGVDVRDTLPSTALKETEEEAGAVVELRGVLRVEHTLAPGGSGCQYTRRQVRMRAIYSAAPVDASAPLKTVPDKGPSIPKPLKY